MGTYIRNCVLQTAHGTIETRVNLSHKIVTVTQTEKDDAQPTIINIPLDKFNEFVDDLQYVRRDLKKLEADHGKTDSK